MSVDVASPKRRGRPKKTNSTKKPATQSQAENIIDQIVESPPQQNQYADQNINHTVNEFNSPQSDFPQMKTRGISSFMHHLFKLGLGKFKKNVALQGEEPKWEDVEHVHFFHTVLSNGQEQDRSTSVGGHFHLVELVKNPDPAGPPKIVKVSPPMTTARRKNRYGKMKTTVVPVEYDDHTHDVHYIGSDEIKPRTVSSEAVKVIGQEASKTAPVQGVIG
jgi:hypothetical protein